MHLLKFALNRTVGVLFLFIGPVCSVKVNETKKDLKLMYFRKNGMEGCNIKCQTQVTEAELAGDYPSFCSALCEATEST